MKNKALKKTLKVTAGIIVFAALLFAVTYFGFIQQSFIVIENRPLDTGVFNFAGQQGAYETVKLRCSDSNDIIHDTVVDGVTYHIEGLNFCNSLVSTNTLELVSNITGINCVRHSGSVCVKENYIQAKELLPAGKYTVNYNYNLNQGDTDSTNVAFTIDSFSASFKDPSSDIQTYEFTLTEPKEVIFKITTGIRSVGGSSDGKMIINYAPEVLTTYYRLTNNSCNSISLLPSQVTANDYTTQLECEQHIIVPPKPPILLIAMIVFSIIIVFVFILILLKRRKHGRNYR